MFAIFKLNRSVASLASNRCFNPHAYWAKFIYLNISTDCEHERSFAECVYLIFFKCSRWKFAHFVRTMHPSARQLIWKMRFECRQQFENNNSFNVVSNAWRVPFLAAQILWARNWNFSFLDGSSIQCVCIWLWVKIKIIENAFARSFKVNIWNKNNWMALVRFANCDLRFFSRHACYVECDVQWIRAE